MYCNSYGFCRESRVQWAAVKMYLFPISDPPHQNSVRFAPCRKIAASHGHSPFAASMPPTIRPDVYSCWPHSSALMILSSISFSVATVVATVAIWSGGRLVVVTVVVVLVVNGR